MIRRTSLILILSMVFIALLVIVLALYTWLLESGENTIGPFKVLYHSARVYNRINNATVTIRSRILGGKQYCVHGSIVTFNLGSVQYTYYCISDMIKLVSVNNSLTINVNNGNSTLTLLDVIGKRLKIYSAKYTYVLTLPENTRQGLYSVNDTYYILNIPYIYFKVRYIKGVGNAIVTIKVTFNINGANISYPPIIKYGTNSDVEVLLSPWEYPLDKETLIRYANALKPLTYLDSNSMANIFYYVEIYVESKGDYIIEVTIGYPGVRIVESNVNK